MGEREGNRCLLHREEISRLTELKGEDDMRWCRSLHVTIWSLLSCSLWVLVAACGTNNSREPADTAAFQTPSSHAAPLTLDFRCHDSRAGGFYVNTSQARVCVQTAPSAMLTITVRFCNGAADPSDELKGSVKADSTGYYEWNWKPQPDCKGHPIWKGDVEVKAHLDGQTTSLSTSDT